jgi:hypothetical protein
MGFILPFLRLIDYYLIDSLIDGQAMRLIHTTVNLQFFLAIAVEILCTV